MSLSQCAQKCATGQFDLPTVFPVFRRLRSLLSNFWTCCRLHSTSTKTKGLPIAKAWYVAINRFKRSNRLAISHPHDAVSEALVRCVTWSPATFVVESAFSTVDRLVSSSRNYSTNREEDVFMLINLHVTFGKQALQSLMERAQRVWSKVYAPSRRHDVKLTPRADQGRRTSCFSIIFGQTYTGVSLF